MRLVETNLRCLHVCFTLRTSSIFKDNGNYVDDSSDTQLLQHQSVGNTGLQESTGPQLWPTPRLG